MIFSFRLIFSISRYVYIYMYIIFSETFFETTLGMFTRIFLSKEILWWDLLSSVLVAMKTRCAVRGGAVEMDGANQPTPMDARWLSRF